RRWVARDPLGIDAVTQVLDRSDEWLHDLVGRPFTIAIPGPAGAAAGGVVSNLVLRGVDSEIQGVVRTCEYVGIAVGLATGLHPLAIACVKHLARDEISRQMSAAIGRVFEGTDVIVGREQRGRGAEPWSPIAPWDR